MKFTFMVYDYGQALKGLVLQVSAKIWWQFAQETERRKIETLHFLQQPVLVVYETTALAKHHQTKNTDLTARQRNNMRMKVDHGT